MNDVPVNSVAFLQRNLFRSLPIDDQMLIKRLGRPTPHLNIEITGLSRNRSYKRLFNSSVYAKTEWICGCDIKHALFCFPCLLFGGDKSWTVTGVKDLSHISQSMKRHEVTRNHLVNEVDLALLTKMDPKLQLDSAHLVDVKKHNELVTKNRYILSRIVECIKFGGAFELSLDDNSDNSIFRGLVNFSAGLDNILKERLDSGACFDVTTKEIQDGLLRCMFEVCRNKIVTEIAESHFVAVMAWETAGISSESQIVVVLRYMHEDNPVERFWGFVNPETHDAESIAQCIHSILDPLMEDDSNKLIAQAYDGATVLSGKSGVHTIIKENYPLAYFTHCYVHQLHLILSQAASQNKDVKVFFSNVEDIIDFFSNSQRLAMLAEIVGRSVEEILSWNFKSRAINIIHEHITSLIECMQRVQEQFSNAKIVNQASSIGRLLFDEVFLFWLNIFHDIMSHVEVLNNQVQSGVSPDSVLVAIQCGIDVFEDSMSAVKNDDEFLIKEEVDELFDDETEPAVKRMRLSNDNLRQSALEVCDLITDTAKIRFQYTDHLIASTLLLPDQFETYSKRFPEKVFKCTVEAYPILEAERLRVELSIIYCRSDFREATGILAFLKMVKRNKLQQTFKEATRLAEIVITTPMSTSETERCFSTLERVNKFLRNTPGEEFDGDKLSALAMLSIENDIIKSDASFNEKVIEMFANKSQSVELIFKEKHRVI